MTKAGARDEALESALRALRTRDRSRAELDARLAARGFHPDERERTLETLERTGILDDRRFAETRSESLAARGASDALIRHELAECGLDAGQVENALDGLEPEIERARRIVSKRGGGAKTARYLQARGYPHDVVAAVVATDEGGELR